MFAVTVWLCLSVCAQMLLNEFRSGFDEVDQVIRQEVKVTS